MPRRFRCSQTRYIVDRFFAYTHPVSIDAEHLCAFSERIIVKRTGHIQKPRLHGGHHDYERTLEKAGRIAYENVSEGPAGSFKATPIINGVKYKAKTFFPPHWTRRQILEKIFEALENRHLLSEIDSSKCYTIVGKTSEGIEIEMILDTKTWIITTAFTYYKGI